MYEPAARLTMRLHSPHVSVCGQADKRLVTEMMFSQVFECFVDSAESEGKTPLKATLDTSIIMHVQEHSQA